MLVFAKAAGWVGLAVCALVALLAQWSSGLLAAPQIFFPLFLGLFVSFVPAVVGHPARRGTPFHAQVSLSTVLRTAPIWASVLTGAIWVTVLIVAHSSGEGHFRLNQASLTGRPDRQWLMLLIVAFFHSTAIVVAESGLRWDSVLHGSGAPALGNAHVNAAARVYQRAIATGTNSLVYRPATRLTWGRLGLELLAVIGLLIALLRFGQSSSTAGYVAIAAVLPSIWRFLVKITGRVTFSVAGGRLQIRAFPLFFQSTSVLLDEVRGIQVNEERDQEGERTHFSLLLISEGRDSKRIVPWIGDYASASQLAAEIDALIAPFRAAVPGEARSFI